MEKYTKAQMEVIEFEAEDVITTSSIKICTSTDYDNIKPDPAMVCVFGPTDDTSEEGRPHRQPAFLFKKHRSKKGQFEI